MEIRFPARKVVKNGYTRSYAIPPAWLSLHDIEPGQLLISKLNDDGSLSILPPPREENEE